MGKTAESVGSKEIEINGNYADKNAEVLRTCDIAGKYVGIN